MRRMVCRIDGAADPTPGGITLYRKVQTMLHRRTWRVALRFTPLLALLLVASPATAECVTAEAYVAVGTQRQPVVPAGTCIGGETEWTYGAGTGPVDIEVGPLTAGGEVSLPLPVRPPSP